MIDKNAKIDTYGLTNYVFDYLRNEVDWYDYSDGGFILTIQCDDDTHTSYIIKFITDGITYNFEISPYSATSSNYVICVYTTNCNNYCVNGYKHVFTYDEIEKFIYDCFE
jgi:hypothetical protein